MQEAKLEDLGVLVREALQEPAHGGRGAIRVRIGVRVWLRHHRLPGSGHLLHPDLWQAVEGAPVVGHRVLRDAVEPGRDLRCRSVHVELLDGAHEDLPGQILGVRAVADAGVHEPMDGGDMRVVDRLESGVRFCSPVRGGHSHPIRRGLRPQASRGRSGASSAAISSRKMASVAS